MVPSTNALASAALKSGFCLATLAAYTRMLKAFLAFLQVVQVSLKQVNAVLVLAFMKFLLKMASRALTLPITYLVLEPCS